MRRRIYYRPEDLEPDRGACPPLVGENYEERHGITRREVKAYEKAHGVEDVLRMFMAQRNNAWRRGIDWEMRLVDWIAVWGDKIAQRGQGTDKLMMCRKDDKGPYRKDNVRLATPHENATDAHAGRRLANWGGKHGGMPHGY